MHTDSCSHPCSYSQKGLGAADASRFPQDLTRPLHPSFSSSRFFFRLCDFLCLSRSMLPNLQSILTAGCLVAFTATAHRVPSPKAVRDSQLVPSARAPVFVDPTCKAIQGAISSASTIYAPGQIQYFKDISE